jgi:putative ABC transport system substrate-binding protein
MLPSELGSGYAAARAHHALGDAAVWPLTAWAQQPSGIRRVGVLIAFDENDPEAKAYLSGFTQGLAELGWTNSRNLYMDVRWAAGIVDRMRMSAKELLDLQPDVILAHGTPATAAFQRDTRTIPIVFASVSDPVGEGFVESLSRPGGNITGFITTEQRYCNVRRYSFGVMPVARRNARVKLDCEENG